MLVVMQHCLSDAQPTVVQVRPLFTCSTEGLYLCVTEIFLGMSRLLIGITDGLTKPGALPAVHRLWTTARPAHPIS